ncbi:hypothetical protein LGN06_04345 [Burkholderia vietnamiensis]|uniref:hypothetical protein n=1 Tax=Burkholderia vietnamiensis TaxID=60552 RepID=UPI001CF198F0|nr:hypothetical protein [Burkholderia vietnamiensis]MCA8390795.1 hypothetical protein [Burkholderia vietnamiensis]
MQPAEHRGKNERLPRFKLDALARARPSSLRVRQKLDEFADARRRVVVEAVWKVCIAYFGASEIPALPFACQFHPLARDDTAGQDIVDVLVGRINECHLANFPHPAGSSMPGSCI